MATYSQVKKGAQGEAVSYLQELLNRNGHSLEVDGRFGPLTRDAVRAYQKQNSLTVDGVVGNQTWSSLFGTDRRGAGGAPYSPAPSDPYAGDMPADYGGNRPIYRPSQAPGDAAALPARYGTARPGAYQGDYAAQIQSVLDEIMNREGFRYDFASDPMYRQYSDRYRQQGKLAMMDTMGAAAALTGGYGSSYAQAAGQQAYQQHLQGLSDIIPELRDAAYEMYRDQGDGMLDRMGLLQELDSAGYRRYRDAAGDWRNDRDYRAGRYDALRDDEYQRYLDELAADRRADTTRRHGGKNRGNALN